MAGLPVSPLLVVCEYLVLEVCKSLVLEYLRSSAAPRNEVPGSWETFSAFTSGMSCLCRLLCIATRVLVVIITILIINVITIIIINIKMITIIININILIFIFSSGDLEQSAVGVGRA